jgi:sodium-independent sulfate anion transporter 11
MAFAPAKVPAALVAAVVSFCVGIWSIIFGLLNLGFIFDFVSVPMSLGFVAGISYVVLTLQIPAILGLVGITGSFTELMPKILGSIGQAKPVTFGIGATSILILAILQFVGNKWGQKSPALNMFCTSRNLFVLGTYTMISYFINKNLETPLWQIIGPIATTIPSPTMPNMQLVQRLILPSLAVFFSSSLEHIALAKAFGETHKYTFNQSQEVFSIGIINLIQSIFGALPVGGGDMARSSILAVSGARSPLNGVLSSITVFMGMYAMSGTFQYMPTATVAAVIMVAIFDQMPPQALIGNYWRVSFVDFLHFLLAFNFTMLASSEIGIGLSLGLMVGYTLMRIMFSRPSGVLSIDLENDYSEKAPVWWNKGEIIPAGTQVITVETDIMFLNAARVARHIVDTVYTYQAGVPSSIHPLARPWNFQREKHIARLRARAGISSVDSFTPRFKVLVLDLSATSFIDTTGMQALQRMKTDLQDYGGEDTEFRFVGLCQGVKRRFERFGWKLRAEGEEEEVQMELDNEGVLLVKEDQGERADVCFGHLPPAVQYQGRGEGTNYYEDEGLQKQ